MTVMARESWTDERLDDLQVGMNQRFDRVESTMKEGFARVDREMKEGFARVDREMKEGFARVDREMKEGFARVDKEMKEGFARVDKVFTGVDGDIRELRGDIKAMQRLMIQGFIGICTLMVTCFAILAGMVGF
jgi:hypothetical protein